jgi:predicted CXXCH cytochrome family protein
MPVRIQDLISDTIVRVFMVSGAYHFRSLVAVFGVCLVTACGSGAGERETPALPAYVGETTCARCHAGETGSWTGSQHDLAMQEATADTVLGDFGTSLTQFGITSRFFTRDGRYFVNTEGADGTLADFEIAYTFGVEPLQQYLVAFPDGRLQVLPTAWDTETSRWFHLYPDEPIPPDDPLFWTGPYQNWNIMCAECHSTDLEKNYDAETRAYDTTWSSIDVSCEACHGPGGDHVEWAARSSREGDPRLVVDLSSPARQIDACAPCHSRRRQISVDDVAGEPFPDHFLPETLREGLYYADGQILDEVYVYGSFLQSRMYREGVVCTDCHDPHSAGLKREGNDVCEQCHDLPSGHSFHAPGSAGAQCVNCHMPSRTYMVVDPRRDHSFRIPRPDLTVSLGTPNACNACHQDETARWAADAIGRWYGPDRPSHFAATMAAGRRGDPEAAAGLSNLVLDPDQAAIVRATAVELLARYGAASLPAVSGALRDPDPLVRATAARALDGYPPSEQIGRLRPLLTDPMRSVRLEAARVLAMAPPASIPPEDRPTLAEELAEYEDVQISQADSAPANLNLGVVHAAAGSADRALADYRTALDLQPDFTPASLNLAVLLNELGRNEEALGVLDDAAGRHPEDGEIHYSMALLLGEMGRMDEAADRLKTSVTLMPERSRVHYNYALALQALDRPQEAETQLLEARRLDAGDPSVVQALSALYSAAGRWDEALAQAQELVVLLPGDPGARQFLESVRAAAAAR